MVLQAVLLVKAFMGALLGLSAQCNEISDANATDANPSSSRGSWTTRSGEAKAIPKQIGHIGQVSNEMHKKGASFDEETV